MVIDDELLHRAVFNRPEQWDAKMNRPTSAIFKDANGVSVDRNAGRTETSIKNSFIARFTNLKGDGRITESFCLSKYCRVEYNPSVNNPHHVLILAADKIELSKGQARALAVECSMTIY